MPSSSEALVLTSEQRADLEETVAASASGSTRWFYCQLRLKRSSALHGPAAVAKGRAPLAGQAVVRSP